ncbi:MAG: SDR family oxidoreductase [Solirubrobacterales bacterium]
MIIDQSINPALAGKVVALTGGARGIGLETIKHLVAGGAKVGAGDMDLTLLRSELAKVGGETAGFLLDVTDRESFAGFIAAVEKELGPIDVLINNAGIMALHPFAEEPDEVSERQLQVNLLGPMHGMKIAIPAMITRGRGHIINVASSAGRFGVPGAAMYSASKFGVYGLTEAAANEYANTPLKFSAICPVVVQTELTLGVTERTRGVPVLRPSDVAAAIVKTIEKPRLEVFVPRSTRLSYVLATVLPPRVRRLIEKFVRADRVLVDIDREARDAYHARAFGDNIDHAPALDSGPAQDGSALAPASGEVPVPAEAPPPPAT